MRVVLVAGPDAGHAWPCIALAAALRDRGAEVVVATGTQWEADLAASELAFLELPLLAPTGHDGDIGYLLWERAGQMATPLAEELAALRPDVVVADTLTRAGAFAAELVGVPWIELSPTLLYDPDPLVPPVGLGARPPVGPWGRLSHRSIRRQQQASFEAGRALGRRVRERLGLRGSGDPRARLVATLPQLEPPRRHWPSRTFVVGPLVWEPPSWPDLTAPEGDGPLVLVSDSTASGVQRTIASTALAWLRADPGVRAVVTTGAALEGVAGRVVVGRGRHRPLLAHADVVVGTAGHGLVTKALAAGVPVVLVPLQGDQRETAARVVHGGFGRRVRPGELSPRRLRLATEQVLGDRSTRRRVARVAEHARRLGPGRAATVVESVLSAVSS